MEWLGDVPEHWGMNRLGVHFRNRKEKVSDKDFKPLSVTKHGIVPQLEHAAKSDNGDNRKLVRKGDYVINSRSDRKGSSGLADLDGSVSLINIVLTPFKTIHPKFSHYLLRSYLFQEEFYKYGHGIVADLWTTNYEDMRNIHLALPSVSEQTQISNFLEQETTRIDNLISKQEKLIELLEEQRKSIISHAVTKGLNPNAPMKDSGVEWLGEVPEHWEVFQLKSAIKGWRNGKWGNEPAAENNICCVRVADFDRTKGVINTTKLTYRNYHGENISECILDENSILIERSGGGEKQLVGATVVNTLKQTAVCSNFISLLNINPNRVNIFFLQKCFENLYTRKVNEKSIKQTSGIQNLDLKQYLQNNIAYPSLDEQKSIVSYLDAECKKIDLLVDKQYQLIRKLKNYRTSIISHAVTGKIDVREFGT